MHHLDPTDEAMENQMPGMLFAANATNEERMLQTLGMLAVELRGEGGEDLNLAEDTSAEITIPVDPSLISIAPPTIPLWSFDEFYGYWKEQGEATLVGNTYVGSVSHFSFWNLDAQFPAVQLCITLVNEDGTPLANQYTTLTHFNPEYLYPTSGGSTDDMGQVCGLVPQDEVLEFNVFNYDACGSASIHTESIGPFSEDSNITVTVMTDTPDVTTETITGIFNDCDGNPVTDGYVILNYGGQLFYENVSDGNFEISLIRCNDDLQFTVEAIDFNTTQTSTALTYTFNTPLTDLGTITACDAIQEFLTYQVDDHPVINYITNLFTIYEGPGGSIIAGHESELGFFSLDIFSSNGVGQYNTQTDNISFFFQDENGDGISPNVPNADITFGGVGSGTEVDYLQVHANADDGVEFFGGAVDVKHLVLTGNKDDSIDWDNGFKGRIQHVFVQHAANAGEANRAIEADNDGSTPDKEPMSNPTIANMTIIGNNFDTADKDSEGIYLREGTQASIYNSVITGAAGECFEVEGVDVNQNGHLTNPVGC